MDETPRFILSLTDTKTVLPGKEGDQYYSVSVGSNDLKDFHKYIPPGERKNAGKNEFQAMLLFFADAVEGFNKEREK